MTQTAHDTPLEATPPRSGPAGIRAAWRGVARWIMAERDTPEYAPGQRAAVARYVEAADARLRCARDAALLPAVAASLLRDAVVLLARAAFAARVESAGEQDAGAAIDELRVAAGPDGTGEDAARRVGAAVTSRDPLYFDAMSSEDLAAAREALEREAWRLRDGIDLRTPAYRTGTRVGRIAALAICVPWLGLVGYRDAFPRRDLALGKPVRASSRQPGSPDPSGLVDGKMASTYGFCTDLSKHDAWGTIDLQRPTDIREIVVYGRSDKTSDESLPMWIEVSNDGKAFREIARRADRFGDGTFLSPPWTVRARESARYVRVHTKAYLVLNEVKIF